MFVAHSRDRRPFLKMQFEPLCDLILLKVGGVGQQRQAARGQPCQRGDHPFQKEGDRVVAKIPRNKADAEAFLGIPLVGPLRERTGPTGGPSAKLPRLTERQPLWMVGAKVQRKKKTAACFEVFRMDRQCPPATDFSGFVFP